MRRFGELRRYTTAKRCSKPVSRGPRHVRAAVRPCHHHPARWPRPCHAHYRWPGAPGQFLAEIGQLSDRAALVDGHAEGDVETLLIRPERLRALLVAEADLGERIMRALILRRVNLIQDGVGGPVLIRPSSLGDMARLQDFLARNGQPHHLVDPRHRQGCRRHRRALRAPARRPAAGGLSRRYCAVQSHRSRARDGDGHDRQPCPEQALRRRGGRQRQPVLPARSMRPPKACRYGGVRCRAPMAARPAPAPALKAHLGFPTGVSVPGAGGARIFPGAEVRRRDADPGRDHVSSTARIATAPLRWRPDADRNCARGRSWWRNESTLPPAGDRKPRRLRRPRHLVLGFADRGAVVRRSGCGAGRGGGNSAGQAAVFLSGHARKVYLVIRGGGLGASMSRYLIDRIEAARKISN